MSELRQRGAAQQQTTRHQQRQQAAAVKAEDVKLVSPAAAETTSSLKFVLACLLLLLPIRMLSALFMPILDCDGQYSLLPLILLQALSLPADVDRRACFARWRYFAASSSSCFQKRSTTGSRCIT
jgi:hypothetical protein